jgi:hypothetical protein
VHGAAVAYRGVAPAQKGESGPRGGPLRLCEARRRLARRLRGVAARPAPSDGRKAPGQLRQMVELARARRRRSWQCSGAPYRRRPAARASGAAASATRSRSNSKSAVLAAPRGWAMRARSVGSARRRCASRHRRLRSLPHALRKPLRGRTKRRGLSHSPVLAAGSSGAPAPGAGGENGPPAPRPRSLPPL